MKTSKALGKAFYCILLVGLLSTLAPAQKRNSTAGAPRVMRFSGVLNDATGAPRSGTAAVIFSLYSEQTGGAPLWQETQNVQLDSQGRYATLLGSGRELPAGIFNNADARWLGVQVLADAEAEQSRVALVSVPYALKAQDAETLGGRPASAYVLSETLNGYAAGGRSGAAAAKSLDTGIVSATGGGTAGSVPKFSATDTLVDSIITEKLVGSDLRIGIGLGATNPSAKLHINGVMAADGFDINTSAQDSVHIINSHPGGSAIEANATSTAGGQTTAVYASTESTNGTGIFAVALPATGGAPTDTSFGVIAYTWNQGAAILGLSIANDVGAFGGFPTFPQRTAIYAGVNSSTAQPLVVQNRHASGTRLISGRNSAGTEVIGMTATGNITATGTVTATAFSGDGSGLSNVSGVGSLAADPAACSANNFVTDIAADGTLTCSQPSSSNLSDVGSLATKTYADAGDASLAAPQYVTLGVSATLANERVLTAGKGIAITDGGSSVTIDNKVDFAQTSIQGGDTVSNFPAGGSEFATTYTIPANTLTAGSVIEVWSAGTLTNGATGNQFGFGVKLGSTVVLPGNVGIFVNASVGPGPWMLNGRIICTSVAGNTATLEAQGFMSEQISSSFSVRNFFNSSTISIDPTVTQELKIYQGVVANDVADTATMRQLIVKILK